MLRYFYDHLNNPNKLANVLSQRARALPFNLHSAGIWYEGSKYYVRRDNREDYYLLFTISGSGFVEYRGKKVTISAGQACLMDCMEPHYLGAYEVWNHIWFHINGSGVKNFFELINNGDFAVVDLESLDFPGEIYNKLAPYTNKADLESELEIARLIMELLGYILLQKQKSTPQHIEDPPPWFQELADYMYLSRNQLITISDLANRYDVTPYKLEKVFKLYYGQEIADVMRSLREDYQKQNSATTKCHNPDWVLDSVVYIKNNFCSKITLQELIDRSHVSRSLFIRKFKQYTSKSPLEYAMDLRLNKALSALNMVDQSISDIAYECGFASASDFSKKFKEWTGFTPNEYRNRK